MSGKDEHVSNLGEEAREHATKAYKDAADKVEAARASTSEQAMTKDKEASELAASAQQKAHEADVLKSEASTMEAQKSDLDARAEVEHKGPGLMDRVRAGLEHAREAITGAMHSTKDSVQKHAEETREQLEEGTETVKEKAKETAETVKEKAASFKEKLHEKMGEMSHKTSESAQPDGESCPAHPMGHEVEGQCEKNKPLATTTSTSSTEKVTGTQGHMPPEVAMHDQGK